MVNSINAFSASILSSVQKELLFVDTDRLGDITDESEANLSTEAIEVIDALGSNKNELTEEIKNFLATGQKAKQTSKKEVAPNMDLSLDFSDIPEPPSAK